MGATASSEFEGLSHLDLSDGKISELVKSQQSGKPVNIERLGKHLFKGDIAKPYLEKQGLPANTLDSHLWATNGNADKVRCF